MQLMLFLYAEESFTDGTKGPSTVKPMAQGNREVGMRAGDKLFICLLTETLTQYSPCQCRSLRKA